MTPQEINAICFKYSLITGIIFYLIYSICRYFGRKKAYEKIIDNLQESEYIVYKPKFSIWCDICPFISGAFAGCFLLPFWLYDSIQYITISGFKAVTRETLPIFIIADIITIIFIFIESTFNVVLTNLRIYSASAFSFLSKLSRLNVKYSDIDYIASKGDYFYIKMKNSKKQSIAYFKNQKRVKQEIEQFLK